MMCPKCENPLRNKNGASSMSGTGIAVRNKVCEAGHSYLTVELVVEAPPMPLHEAIRRFGSV